MDISLPYNITLRPYQQEYWDAVVVRKVKRAVTVWPRRNGKDLIAINILVAKSIQRKGLYLYIAPFHTQIRAIIWNGSDDDGRKFLDYIPEQLVVKKRESVMEIELINGSIIKLVGSDNIDSIVGTNPVGIIYTEFSLQKPAAWGYMRPILANNGGWAIFNGTPRGMNHFYEMHKMAQKNDDWFHQYLTRDDTQIPSLEAIESERKGGMRESLIEQEFYGSWTSSSEDVFIPLDIIEPTTLPEASLHEDMYSFKPRILGCDVAYAAKGDLATIAYRQGRKLHWVRGYRGRDNMAFADEISRFIKMVRPHAVNIDAGRGEGVISRLFQLGYDGIVNPIHFGGKVYEEGYANMKAVMWHRTLEWFEDNNIPDLTSIDDHEHANLEDTKEKLLKELSTPFMVRNEKNEIAVESKQALKTRGESSPDLAEAVTLTTAVDVDEEILPTQRQSNLGITSELINKTTDREEPYDPMTFLTNMGNEDFGDFEY